MQVVTRKAVAEDKDFLMDSWIRGQYYGNPYWTQVPKHIFHTEFANYISHLIERPETKIEVAILEDDPNMIVGIMVYSNKTLHWAYTKTDYRGAGVLNLLMKGKDIQTVSCTTLPGAAITKKKKLIFNPFIGEPNET